MVCPHCELAHPPGTTACSRCGRPLSSPDEQATVVFDSADATAPAFKPVSPPAVASGVVTPPPAGESQIKTAIRFSGAFSMALQPGTDFGPRYRIEGLIGEGGMGSVYKATDKELGRTVALKLVRPEFAANPAAMARFRQELLLASKISHRNVLRIHDLGDAGGMKFITMAYVEGADLGRIMEAGRLPLERVLSFARQLCGALDAAHSEEVVHRDLKPNNILIDKADNLYVMDFGLAKSIEAEATMMTRTGQILGTPRYMAPEQVEAKSIDHRADIYAFGLILYEMLTGEIPFQADSAMQLMYLRVTQKPRDIKLLNPDVPDYLARIVMRCLETEPEARYQSAREILADLDAQNAPPLRAPASVGAQTISIQLPRPSRLVWIAGALVLLLAGLFAVPAVRRIILPPGAQKTAGAPTAHHYLAILPLRVIGDADKTQYVADGVVDSVSAKLSGLSDVYVASAGAVAAAMGKKDPQKIARTLGVTLLVQGTVQSSADRIAVTISLDDVNRGRSLFHQEFSGVREDLLTLEDKIFDSLVNALAVKPSNEELARTALRPTQDIGAYELYLKGRNLWRRSQAAATTQEAISQFEQALKVDPRFALAYAGLADAQLLMFRQTKETLWAQNALGAARQAEALNDSLPDVHFVMGSVDTVTGNTAEAVAELKRALQLAPNSDEALRRLGGAYLALNQTQAGIASYQRAIQVNPYFWNNSYALGAAYFSLGDNAKARAAFQQVIKLDPERAQAYNAMGAVYLREGMWNDAIPMFQKTIALQPAPLSYSNLGTTYFFLGQYNIAAQAFEKAAALSANDPSIRANLGDAYRWAGQRDKATAAYDQAITLALRRLGVNPKDTEALGDLAIAYAKKGDPNRAMDFIRQARSVDPKANVLMYKEATVDAIAGREKEGLASLSEALRNGYSLKEALSDPELKSMRQMPEFDTLRKQLTQTSASLSRNRKY